MGIRNVGSQSAQELAQTAAQIPVPRPRTTESSPGQPEDQETAAPVYDKEQVRGIAQAVQENLSQQRAGTRLRVDEDTNQIIVQILDENNQVIRQIPPEELLKVAAKLRDINARIFDQSV